MKKIIAAFDGLKYSDSAASYAIEFAKQSNGKVFGVFLEDFTYHSYAITDLIDADNAEQRAAYLNHLDAEDREISVKSFTNKCREEGILYSIHRDKNIAIRELLHESKYADTIIVQNNETLTHYPETAPTTFITELLERSECPVVLVPPTYRKVEKVVFLYDASPSSVFAIKQFAYLVPHSEDLESILLTVNSKKDENLPDGFYIKEWLKLYFPNVQYNVLSGNPELEITNFLKEQTKNCLIVLGAYQRGIISRFLHKSTADSIMNAVDVPLFISHR